jgi:hypothetical protein
MRLKINKQFLLTAFCFFALLFVVSNPTLVPLNLTISTTQLSATSATSPDGISIQGSMVVNQWTEQVTATNTTSGEQVQAYQISAFAFNGMTVFLLLLPWVVYAYATYPQPKIKVQHTPRRKQEPKLTES